MPDSAQMRFKAACERFGIPVAERRALDESFIMDEEVERRVVVCPATEAEADAVSPVVLIEDEA